MEEQATKATLPGFCPHAVSVQAAKALMSMLCCEAVLDVLASGKLMFFAAALLEP